MAAKKKSSPASSRRLFPSPRHIPNSVRWSCETWMCFFEDFTLALLDSDANQQSNLNRVKLARELADQALEEIQDRWPGIQV